jgi:hypothetical protein
MSAALIGLSDEELARAATGQLSLVAEVTPTQAMGALNDRYPVLARLVANQPTAVIEVIGEWVQKRRQSDPVPFRETWNHLFPEIHPTQQKLQFSEAA